MSEAFIIDAVRTPRGIGKAGKGALAHLHPQQLGATVLQALRARNDIDTGAVGDIVWGCSTQFGRQGANLGRMSALLAGYEVTASGMTLDRFCGSGITATCIAASQIMSGMEDVLIAGGAEMMSYTGSLGDPTKVALLDCDNPALRELHPQSHQGVCADAIATMQGITRRAADELALESQRRGAIAIAQARFEKSLVPVRNADGSIALDKEQFPRPGTTLETLSTLAPAFAALADYPINQEGLTYRKLINQRYPDLAIEHIHHAGNSSGVVDGAAAILLAAPKAAGRYGWTPRGRVVAMANMGDCPTLMLNAPVAAARKVLAKAGLKKADIDVWEINEAFAVVAEKFIRDLDLDRERVNINGGAIALGHPIGATGVMLIGAALDELERSDGKYALITMCAAGGMAPAMVIERIAEE